MHKIPIYEIYKAPNTKKYVNKVINSNWLTTGGYFNDAVEEKLKDLLKCKFVLLTNNGTTSTHLLSKIIKKKNKNINTIICQDNVYVAAWNSFLFDKEFNLEIIDIDNETWNFDKNKLREKLLVRSPDNTAILIVHNIGNPFIIDEKNFITVEDNCEGFLGEYNNVKTGTKSNCLASSISFFANKNITSGEGGAIITNDEESYMHVKNVHAQGQSSERFIHDNLGYNYRMTNLTAAVLYSQIEVLDEIIEKKEFIFKKYMDSLNNIEEITFQRIENNCKHSNWLFGIKIKNSDYNKARIFFDSKGIETRPMFYSAKQQPYLTNFINDKKVILDIQNEKDTNQIVFFPSFPALLEKEINYIVSQIKKYILEIKIK